MSRRAPRGVVASPLLVGAVTVLVTIVAVFLAYNANEGLPFVPTYEVNAQLPNGEKLIKGNEVRIGGDRVGQVTDVKAQTIERDGRPVTIAVIEMALEKRVEPLPVDSIVKVRPRSLLGLKYVELTPGNDPEPLLAGGTLPLANARTPVELEDVLSTFDAETRVASRAALEGYGDAFADRGEDLNTALHELRPFLQHLEPVMAALSDPDTRLGQLFRQIGNAAGQAAPVAEVQAALFGNMARTFEALSRNETALQQTIERSPATLDAAISSFEVQRPFLTDFAALSRELRPASAELARALPPFDAALRTGIPALRGVPPTNRLVERTLRSLDELAQNPATLLALQNLDTTIDVTEPLISFVAPYQTVCDFFNYFVGPLGTHISEEVQGGTIERVSVVLANPFQDNSVGSSNADRPASVPAGEDPQTAQAEGQARTRLATQFNGRAITPDGRADCETGQRGYPDGPLYTTGRYGPNEDGGGHVLIDPETPGVQGGTYRARELGIDGLEDVP